MTGYTMQEAKQMNMLPRGDIYDNSRDMIRTGNSTGAVSILGAREMIRKLLKSTVLVDGRHSDAVLLNEELYIKVTQMYTDKLKDWVDTKSFPFKNINLPMEDYENFKKQPNNSYFIRITPGKKTFSVTAGKYILMGKEETRPAIHKGIMIQRKFWTYPVEGTRFYNISDGKAFDTYIKEGEKTWF